MGAAEVMSGEWRSLHPAFISAERITFWVMLAVVMAFWTAAAALAWWLAEIPRWVDLIVWGAALILVPLLVWLATSWPAINYRHWSYRLDEQGIEIRSGVFVRSVTSVPKSRVQHTDVSQGPIERRFGLGTLSIYTAGTEYAQVALPGLEHAVAMGIRDALLPKTGADAV